MGKPMSKGKERKPVTAISPTFLSLPIEEQRAKHREWARKSRERLRQGIRLRRRRRSPAQLAQLSRQIMDFLRKHHPQSIRHVYYVMTNPRLPQPVEKTETGYVHVQRRMVSMRRDGTLPYGWVIDTSRSGIFVNTFTSPKNFIETMLWQYRADPWLQSKWYCEVWVESRSISGVIEELCDEYGVTLYPCGGFTSLTLAFEASPALNRAAANGKKLMILYIGDWDQSGVIIDKSVEKELREHLNRGVQLHFERIAITEEQIAEYDLPTKPRKEGDKRSRHVKETVEAEAMPAHILRDLLRTKFDALLPKGALAKARKESERGQAALERIAEELDEDDGEDAL
jgi:hypothetical protein